MATAGPVRAWDSVGHEVVARIAWERLRPETRAKAVALLKAAPPDADIANLVPPDGRPAAVRDRELFERAATWGDVVRDEKHPARKEKYSRPAWHFIHRFWEQPDPLDPKLPPRDLPDRKPDLENVVARLHGLEQELPDAHRPAAERAVDLAWLLHLVGDVHQPMHTAARVTAAEPQGDDGGLLFALDPNDSLHWYWDTILGRSEPRNPRKGEEDEDAYAGRLAAFVMAREPAAALEEAADLRYEDWVDEGYRLDKTEVYDPALVRGRLPGEAYRRHAEEVALPRLALAGYRLSALLEKLLGTS
jgi:hypothetical protein